MGVEQVRPELVDRIEVLVLVDNYADALLAAGPAVVRPELGRGGRISEDALLAEHGLSLLVTASRGAERRTVLLDTGYTPVAMLHNAGLLGVDLDAIEAVVLSHGHMDHTGSLLSLLERRGSSLPVVAHPDALRAPRVVRRPGGVTMTFPAPPRREDLAAAGAELHETAEPTLLADGAFLVTGEIPRTTSFERGLPGALIDRGAGLEPDLVADDQAIALRLRDHGLVVVTGCAHAGVVNTVRHAVELTGEDRVHAVLGGFHLGGPAFAEAVEPTVAELASLRPTVLSPMHCTGPAATARIADALPDSFTRSTVGSTLRLPPRPSD